MSAVSTFLSRAALLLSGCGLIAMTAIISWQVFARYVLNAAPAWTEQAALLLMLWFILFAAASGVREGFHIRLTIVQDLAGAKIARPLRLICHGIVMAVALVMTWEGVALASATWDHRIPTLGLSRTIAFWPFAGAGALTAFFAFEHIIAELTGKTVEPIWN